MLTRSIALQRRSLELVTDRHDLGAASGLDVAQQQALIDSTLDAGRRAAPPARAVRERDRDADRHARAGCSRSRPISRRATPPPIPVGVPSDILERRPDVAAAERAMAAANAQIGVANAAFYPSIILGGVVRLREHGCSRRCSIRPSLIWSLGVSLLQPLFDAGRLQANVDFTKAGYDVTVANYRRVVLTAMQEVEDGITGHGRARKRVRAGAKSRSRARRARSTSRPRATKAASRRYLDVITAQQALLNAERLASQLQGQRLLPRCSW